MEDVRVAYQTMTASNANLARIRDELIPLQQQRRTLAEDAYRAGQSDVTALFLAEQDLRLTQAKAIEVERQAVREGTALRVVGHGECKECKAKGHDDHKEGDGHDHTKDAPKK